MVSLPFRDREEAARQLLVALAPYRGSRPVVLAIPRGAVPMGRIVAEALDGELDVVLVRKLGAPFNPEYAIGAIDENGSVVLNEQAGWLGGGESYVRREAERQLALIRERRARYRPGQPPVALEGRTVIVIDDGLATGSTMKAALIAARAQHPRRLVCAVPVAAQDSLADVARFADDVVCLATPRPFDAVGLYYRNFVGVTDEQVVEALAAPPPAGSTMATAATPDGPASVASPAFTTSAAPSVRQVLIPSGEVALEGELTCPAESKGLVIFAHGSGSSRHSPRNRQVAAAMQERSLCTLLFDLLTANEDRDAQARFDIPLLATRLADALAWARQASFLEGRPIGLFGASTGAAAALVVAARHPEQVAAVVSRGGRPDLAGAQVLSKVRTHTLLIVGSADTEVVALNRAAQALMGDWANVVLVPGATHLFEEPGTLEQAALLAAGWFRQWL